MRAGPLSNLEVINLLNAHYLPVYAVNEDYHDDGPQPPNERQEFRRIYLEALDAKLSSGSVHVYITSPDGETVDSMHVAQAAETDKLLATLKRNIKRFDIPPGETLVKPRPQSAPPKGAAPDAVVLHLVSRALAGGGSWGGVVENWVVLAPEECSTFLSGEEAKVEDEWRITPDISAKLLTHFYPSTENNDVSRNEFEHQHLTAKVIEIDPEKSTATVRLEGSLKMKHPFYHQDDANVAEADVAGYVIIHTGTRRIREFGLTTAEATYGGGQFGVGVRLAH